MRQAIDRLDTLRLLITDSRIVDDRIEGAKRIDLLGNNSGLCDAAQISHNHCLRLRDVPLSLLSAGLAASVQDHLMPLADKQLRSHFSEAVRRSGNEYACHNGVPPFWKLLWRQSQFFSERSFNVVSQSWWPSCIALG